LNGTYWMDRCVCHRVVIAITSTVSTVINKMSHEFIYFHLWKASIGAALKSSWFSFHICEPFVSGYQRTQSSARIFFAVRASRIALLAFCIIRSHFWY